MNKMNDSEIHAVLDGVKAGDEVRIYLQQKILKVKGSEVELNYLFLRYYDGALADEFDRLLSIENLGQPEPPEPEVGSFALTKTGCLVKRLGSGWYFTSWSYSSSWSCIKPLIKILYNPDGSINEGWE